MLERHVARVATQDVVAPVGLDVSTQLLLGLVPRDVLVGLLAHRLEGAFATGAAGGVEWTTIQQFKNRFADLLVERRGAQAPAALAGPHSLFAALHHHEQGRESEALLELARVLPLQTPLPHARADVRQAVARLLRSHIDAGKIDEIWLGRLLSLLSDGIASQPVNACMTSGAPCLDVMKSLIDSTDAPLIARTVAAMRDMIHRITVKHMWEPRYYSNRASMGTTRARYAQALVEMIEKGRFEVLPDEVAARRYGSIKANSELHAMYQMLTELPSERSRALAWLQERNLPLPLNRARDIEHFETVGAWQVSTTRGQSGGRNHCYLKHQLSNSFVSTPAGRTRPKLVWEQWKGAKQASLFFTYYPHIAPASADAGFRLVIAGGEFALDRVSDGQELMFRTLNEIGPQIRAEIVNSPYVMVKGQARDNIEILDLFDNSGFEEGLGVLQSLCGF